MLSEKMKGYRKERKMSQYEFARFLGISRSYIGDVERSRVKGSVNLIKLLVEKTGLDYSYWIDGDTIDKLDVSEIRDNGLIATESIVKVVIETQAYDPVTKKVLPNAMDSILRVLEEEIKMKIMIYESNQE